MWTMVSLTKFDSSKIRIGSWGKDNELSFQPVEFATLQFY